MKKKTKHTLLVGEGVAQIALQELQQELAVLLQQGAIQAQLRPQRRPRHLIDGISYKVLLMK